MTVRPDEGIPSSDEIDIARYVHAIWRARWAIVIVTVLATGFTWFFVGRATPHYRATAALTALTPYGSPLDAAATAQVTSALEGRAAWARALAETGAAGRVATRFGDAVSVGSPNAANQIALYVTVEDPGLAVTLANRMAAAGVAALQDLRAAAADSAAGIGASETEAARRDATASSDRLTAFLAASGIRIDQSEPVDQLRRPVPARVRKEYERLSTEDSIARTVYMQARLWQIDMRRQATYRVPGLKVTDPAVGPAVKIGPRPRRAAAIAAVVAFLLTLAASIVWEIVRPVWGPSPAAAGRPERL